MTRGEGEETMIELVKALELNTTSSKLNIALAKIDGLSWRNRCDDSLTHHNPDRTFIKNLDEYPIPDFSIIHNWKKKAKVLPIATSRGCPFGCKFCSVIPMFGRKYRFKSTDRVLKEIEEAMKYKLHIVFMDDNFTANIKRTKELLHEIIKRNIKFEWSAQIRTEAANDEELIRLMKKAGCFVVFIGFESINPKTLTLYDKGQKIEDIENAIRTVKKHGINTHGMFVLGSDTDDIQTIRNTAKFAKKLDIESVQLLVLTPLPGTEVFNELEESGRIIHKDWSKYNGQHAVFEPNMMTALELHIETLKAMAKFYSWSAVIKNIFQRDFFYVIVSMYGKKSVKKLLLNAKSYLRILADEIQIHFDSQTMQIRKKIFKHRSKLKVVILCNNSYHWSEDEKKEGILLFLNSFLNGLGIIPAVYPVKPEEDDTLTITILLPKMLSLKREKIKIDLNPDLLSTFKICEHLARILSISSKKLRKTYDDSLKENKGIIPEFNNIEVVVKQ